MSWRRRSHDDFNREIQSHIAIETDRLIAEGMTPEDARTRALRQFGNVTTIQERFYEGRRVLWFDRLLTDCRFAMRSMAKYPLACTIAVLSLSAGIGCTTAMLTLRNAIFFNAPPLYQIPEELSFVGIVTPESPRPQLTPSDLYRIWKDQAIVLSGIAAATATRTTDVRTSANAETVAVRAVTPELFSVVGVPTAIGRSFSSATAREAVISYRTWQVLFHGRSDVVGGVVHIDGEPLTVVGVMPERFWFTDMRPAVWTPLNLNSTRLADFQRLEVVVRRAPNVTPLQLENAFQASVDRYVTALPESEREMRTRVIPVTGTPVAGQVGPPIVVLFGLCVVLTLFISCTNVAILMMAQWTAREREIAIRASLGASRGRVVRLLLTESILMSLLGGIFGVCATFALRSFILRHGPADIGFYDFSIHFGVLLQSAVVALIVGVLVGIAPALYETRGLQANPLRFIPSDRVRQRWRHALVVIEITTTIALLVVTSTMIDGYRRNMSMDLGYPTNQLIVGIVRLPSGAESSASLWTSFAQNQLGSLPGVASAVASTAAPLIGRGSPQRVSVDQSRSNSVTANGVSIGVGFFSTLEVPLRRGRDFTSHDGADVVIVNEVLANRLWPNRDPLEMYLWNDNRAYRVVGVAANYRNSILAQLSPNFYFHLSDTAKIVGPVHFIVRASSEPGRLVQPIRDQFPFLPNEASPLVTPLQDIIDQSGQEILTLVYPMSALIMIATLLTATGIYSILDFAISRGSKELAVRLAVGASNRHLAKIVATHSLRLVTIGIFLGIGSTFALSRLAQGAGGIFDSPSFAVFVVPILIILLVGVLAAWIPSRRAMSINPAILLRSE